MNIHDTIFINIKGNFNLRDTSGGWGDTIKVKFTKRMIIFGHLSFSFKDLNQDSGLIISISGENL
jgi:hypothetical protein